MIQKAEKIWQTNNTNIQIVDMDGRLGFTYDKDIEPYFERFLYWCTWREYSHVSAAMIRGDINLKNYRDSLIKDVEHISRWSLYEVLNSAFNEDYMCEYLYTHESISKNLAKKVWNDIVYKQYLRIYNFAGECKPDVKRYAVKALSNLKSNNDMIKISEDIRMMLLERFMEKHGRARLQKAMKRITNEQFKGHKQMADRQIPEPKGGVH